MVTFAQAQERAEEWINAELPAYQHREVRVREFGLGFVVWAEDRAEGPRSDGGGQRLVIARDSGEATLWPALPVGEVIRRYEEEYGAAAQTAEPAAPPARVDLNQTSFLLTPPEWLQEAADRMGVPGGTSGGGTSGGRTGAGGAPAAVPPSPAGPPTPPASPAPGELPQTQAGVPAPPSGGSGAWDAPGAAEPAAASAQPAASGTDAGPTARGTGESGAFAFPDAPADTGEAPRPGPGADTGHPAPAGPGTPAPQGAEPGPPEPAAPSPSPAPTPWPAAPAEGADGAGAPVGGAQDATPWAGTDTNADQGEDRSVPLPATVFAPQIPENAEDTENADSADGPDGTGERPPGVAPEAKTALMSGGSQLPPTAVAPAVPGPDNPAGAAPGPVSYGYPGAPPPSGTPAPPGAGPDAPPSYGYPGAPAAGPGTPPPPAAPGGGAAGGYVPTQLVSSLGGQNPLTPGNPTGPGTPPPSNAAGAGGPPGPPTPPPNAPGAPGAPGTPPGAVHHAETMLASPGGPGTPPPPSAPGAPGTGGSRSGLQPPGPPTPPPNLPGAPGAPGTPPPGAVHHAETMLASPGGPGTPPPPNAPGAPGTPPPPNAPGAPGTPPPGAPPAAPGGTGGGVHQAATMLAGPGQSGPLMPPPGGPGTPPPPAAPATYGYPQQPPGQPTVGPGYQAVLRYRAQDGSEQQLIRRSAPGIPHPEWQIFHELQAMGVPPQQVLELHTELESCELPGAYCARMIREQWPQARITSIAPYGTDHASRQQGMQQLLAHQGELHQVADAPPRLAPVRAPLPQVQQAPPLRPEELGQELAAAFGPGVFRFEQRAVARQGVPEAVSVTLMWAGLPVDVGPFFWAQAQPGRPVPTLAEVAQERGVQPAADAGSYLVMGSDFGRAVCVQYGTANIVAVPVEPGPGGASAPPQFVNTGLPEFVRCLALLGRMWRLRFGLNQEQAGRWTVDFQAQLAALDPAALASPENWWSVLLEQMWDGLL
ncbi:SUKH-4 family immunity protein [Streptomyces sp. NPDC050560]|uniref:SUKH-4 family immunity protein n=1 Tax=Streptomyces sp. NPDC050560 TaxID=3365630 RepID=UPI00379A2139